jgi:dihydrofolate synthase/folylpolyglutamate synthase
LIPVGSLSQPGTLPEWLELLESRHPKAVDLGLERCRAIWELMGSPQPSARVFVVAGTNGKGSTVATLCALLDVLGFRHGSYTSPHIEKYNERVRLNGVPVSDQVLIDAFARIEEVRGDLSLSYFEFGTLAAIDILARARLEFAVMEVGLGGRLDAVNILDADCAVITPIGLDHQEYLGNDLDSIGREKAGIIRAGRPVICSDPGPPASIVEYAQAKHAPLKQLGRDFRIHERHGYAHFSIEGLEMDVPLPVLAGKHQLNNMAGALAALFELIPAAISMPAALGQGLRSVSLHGRFEQIQRNPVVWLDVGHNPLAAKVVAGALADAMRVDGIERCVCVLGMLADKDAAAVARAFGPLISSWYCAGLGSDRGQSGLQLANRLSEGNQSLDLQVFDTVASALDAALAGCSSTDAVLVFGSFLTVTDAMRHLGTDTARILPDGQG